MQTHANEAMHDGGSRGWSPWCTCFIIWIFSYGTWLTREPPCRIFFQTVSNQTQTLSFPFDVTSLPARFSQSVRREPFRFFLGSCHHTFPVTFNWSIFARKMHSTSEFAMTVLSYQVCQSCVCLRVYMCKHVSLPVSVFERLSAYLCVCIFHIFSTAYLVCLLQLKPWHHHIFSSWHLHIISRTYSCKSLASANHTTS